jgi:uncharacterized membrane protein
LFVATKNGNWLVEATGRLSEVNRLREGAAGAMTMNPFDLKSALLAKHAQHVVLIHFPIALFISSVAFDLLAIWRGSRSLAKAAYYNLIGAAITALAAVGTGVLAWQLQLQGEKLRGNLRLHLSLGTSSAVLICLLAWWRSRQERADDGNGPAFGYWALAFIAVVMVALTGHLGGILSGVEVPN